VDKAEEYRVLVPENYDGDWMYVVVDRHSKCSTLVGCISADGSSMRPMTIVDRVTMEADLNLYGDDVDGFSVKCLDDDRPFREVGR
jgi:hypothetical protein